MPQHDAPYGPGAQDRWRFVPTASREVRQANPRSDDAVVFVSNLSTTRRAGRPRMNLPARQRRGTWRLRSGHP